MLWGEPIQDEGLKADLVGRGEYALKPTTSVPIPRARCYGMLSRLPATRWSRSPEVRNDSRLFDFCMAIAFKSWPNSRRNPWTLFSPASALSVWYKDRSGRTVLNDDSDDWLEPAFEQTYRVLRDDSFCVSFYGYDAADRFIRAWRRGGVRHRRALRVREALCLIDKAHAAVPRAGVSSDERFRPTAKASSSGCARLVLYRQSPSSYPETGLQHESRSFGALVRRATWCLTLSAGPAPRWQPRTC